MGDTCGGGYLPKKDMVFNYTKVKIMQIPMPQQFQSLESVTKPTVDTATAAYYLNRRPQTLRIWAMNQHPIRPLNIHGRLAWPVGELKRVLGMAK